MSDYPTCKTCKHWTASTSISRSWGWRTDSGECIAFLNEKDGSRLTLIEEVITTFSSFGCLLHSDLTEATL